MKSEVVLVTPELAKHMLAFNQNNRPMSQKNVTYWKSCLIGNDVKLTHQGIAIQGTIANPIRLIDGQHRLQAIVETGIPASFLLSENVHSDAFAALDNGMPRSLAVRANIDRTLSQFSSCMFYTRAKGTAKPPVKLIQEIALDIQFYCNEVKPLKRRSISIIPILLAFVLQQKKYGFNDSEAFQLQRFNDLSPSLQSLLRRQARNPIGIGGGDAQKEAFAATWNAVEKPTLSKIHIPQNSTLFCQESIDAVFPNISRIMKSYGMLNSHESK